MNVLVDLLLLNLLVDLLLASRVLRTSTTYSYPVVLVLVRCTASSAYVRIIRGPYGSTGVEVAFRASFVHYRVFGYLGIVRRASIEKEREVRTHHGNVISAQPVYLYNCPNFEAASSKCPNSVKKSPWNPYSAAIIFRNI